MKVKVLFLFCLFTVAKMDVSTIKTHTMHFNMYAAGMYTSMCVEVKGQSLGVSSLLPSCRS